MMKKNDPPTKTLNLFNIPETKAGIYLFVPFLTFVLCRSYIYAFFSYVNNQLITTLICMLCIYIWIKHVKSIASGATCTCIAPNCLQNEIVVITGASRGIGRALVSELLALGATMYVLCRRPPIQHDRLHYIQCDLSDLLSVKLACARLKEDLTEIDILINNAAIQGNSFEKCIDGFESHFTINYLSHFYITLLLKPLITYANGRIINVSCFAHCWENSIDISIDMDPYEYDLHHAYGCSKLALVMHVQQLQANFNEEDNENECVAVCADPGAVNTYLDQDMSMCSRLLAAPMLYLMRKSPKEGMQTILHCCTSPSLVPGGYYQECKLGYSSVAAENAKDAKDLWCLSESMIENGLNRRKISIN